MQNAGNTIHPENCKKRKGTKFPGSYDRESVIDQPSGSGAQYQSHDLIIIANSPEINNFLGKGKFMLMATLC